MASLPSPSIRAPALLYAIPWASSTWRSRTGLFHRGSWSGDANRGFKFVAGGRSAEPSYQTTDTRACFASILRQIPSFQQSNGSVQFLLLSLCRPIDSFNNQFEGCCEIINDKTQIPDAQLSLGAHLGLFINPDNENASKITGFPRQQLNEVLATLLRCRVIDLFLWSKESDDFPDHKPCLERTQQVSRNASQIENAHRRIKKERNIEWCQRWSQNIRQAFVEKEDMFSNERSDPDAGPSGIAEVTEGDIALHKTVENACLTLDALSKHSKCASVLHHVVELALFLAKLASVGYSSGSGVGIR